MEAKWCWAKQETGRAIERDSAKDLKVLGVHNDGDRNWLDPEQGESSEFLRNATEIKNIWTPYGD